MAELVWKCAPWEEQRELCGPRPGSPSGIWSLWGSRGLVRLGRPQLHWHSGGAVCGLLRALWSQAAGLRILAPTAGPPRASLRTTGALVFSSIKWDNNRSTTYPPTTDGQRARLRVVLAAPSQGAGPESWQGLCPCLTPTLDPWSLETGQEDPGMWVEGGGHSDLAMV